MEAAQIYAAPRDVAAALVVSAQEVDSNRRSFRRVVVRRGKIPWPTHGPNVDSPIALNHAEAA
jgi:hypothetical protein